MKDPLAEIRKGYIDRMATLSVGVFDKEIPADRADMEYVLVTSQTYDEVNNNKSTFKGDCSIVLDVVVRSRINLGSKVCDDIAAEVLALVYPTRNSSGNISAGDNHQVVTTRLIQNESLHTHSSTEHVHRRIIRLLNKVVEK